MKTMLNLTGIFKFEIKISKILEFSLVGTADFISKRKQHTNLLLFLAVQKNVFCLKLELI